jgi:hypothetical protein
LWDKFVCVCVCVCEGRHPNQSTYFHKISVETTILIILEWWWHV